MVKVKILRSDHPKLLERDINDLLQQLEQYDEKYIYTVRDIKWQSPSEATMESVMIIYDVFERIPKETKTIQ